MIPDAAPPGRSLGMARAASVIGMRRGRYRGSTSISDVVTVVPGTSADVICDVATPVPSPVPFDPHRVARPSHRGPAAELVDHEAGRRQRRVHLALPVGVLGADQEVLARRGGLRSAVGERNVLLVAPCRSTPGSDADPSCRTR